MINALLLVMASTCVYAGWAPLLARGLPPAVATRLLVVASLAVTAAVWFVLAVAAFTWIGQQPEIAELGPWSPQLLRTDTPIGFEPAVAASAALAAVSVWAIVVVTRRARALLDVHRLCGRLGQPGALVVLETDTPDAFTTPEAIGRIIITRGMLHALRTEERAALLAHERSHLMHRHTWWNLVMDLAAAANPLLRPTARAVRQMVERWADEDAAQELADRRLVARTLARAALARHAHAKAQTNTAATGGDVPARIQALLNPPALHRRLAATVLAVLLVGVGLGSISVERHGERLFERAEASSSLRQ